MPQVASTVTEPGFSLANSWMNTPRADYVNNIDVTDHGIDAKTGCAILFIYYLHTQLGYSIKDIIAAAASELSGVYKNLTGDPSDPFPPFKNLLDTYYPGTTTIPVRTRIIRTRLALTAVCNSA
jgi:hypothetical protein